ncbi:MAG TPA: acyl-CoA dehydrogenase family protein [Pseudolabrys sp.]
MFDRKIGQNQAIQHPLPTCWMQLEAASLMTLKAAALYDAGEPCGIEANDAKYPAAEERFVSYKELADASGANWNQVHYSIGGHLWSLVEYAHRKGWPMLSAVVVNKQNVASGSMEPETLKGFIAAARELGFSITDEEAFLREQQRRVFEWAKGLVAAS